MKKEKDKKKLGAGCLTFIILIVIFIIFSLIAGLIAYDAMNKAAKAHATKTTHAQTAKYMRAELEKCKLGETTAMDGLIKCSNNTVDKTIKVVVGMMTDVNPYSTSAFDNTPALALRASNSNTNDEDVGYISLSTSGSNIIIKSCNKTPCNEKANRQSSTVSIK